MSVGEVFPFKHTGTLTKGDATLIPVTDGDYFTDDMNGIEYEFGDCFLQFINVAADGTETVVTPTAGTAQFRAGAFKGQFLETSTTASRTIQATEVEAGNASYTPPSFNSRVVASKMTLTGITGATHVRAMHWRH